ncbi:MAG: hypothetical protein HKM98_08520, partial [Gammaproteobacteria bacterium]|nr:hypothetical protein [Gammaproteobacteria bacterium]
GADDREQHGRSQPELHSWRHGLDRLMLGFALPGQDSDTFDDLLPFDEVEGSAALVLGGLAEFVAKLKRFANELEQEKPAREWADWLLRQLDQFFSIADDAESEAQKLRNVFARLAEQSLAAKHDDRISSEIVSDWLIRQLRDVKSTGRYLGYGATFCGIVPMRNVPVPIVCLIGLNDTAFPRMESPVGFDLIAQKPRRGDRSRRDDDRHAFLESVMNARKVLYMSYIGRGIRDDASIPPCLLVSELLEYCNRAFERHDKKHPSDVMTTLHKVQGFSRKYFDASNPALFSYDDAISIRADQQSTPPEFVAGVIGSSVDELLPVSLDNLTRFFSDPAKALLQNRLGIFYSGDAEEINTHDPVSVYGLESWKLGSWMLQLRISGLARSHVKQMATKSRYAPGGAAGLVVIEKHMQQVDQMLEKLQSRLPEGQSHAVAVDCTESGIAITGRLENLYPNGQYLWRFGKTRAKDQLIFWIHHLVLNLAQPDGVANASVWISENKTLSLPPIEDAAQHLAVLTELFVCGLQQALPFFPDPSLAYVKNLRTRNGNRTKALLTAKTRYDIHLNQYGKDSQPYTQRVFLNGVDWDRFEELATAVFDPMLDYMR